jgi:hypothetical protein
MQVKPLTDLLGAEITEFDLTRPLDQAVKRELCQHFVDNAVLVFRDQHFDPPQFAAAAQIFGEIIPEQFPNYRLPQYPTVSFLSNSDLQKSGKRRAVRGEGFHTDHSNYAAPPKATILFARPPGRCRGLQAGQRPDDRDPARGRRRGAQWEEDAPRRLSPWGASAPGQPKHNSLRQIAAGRPEPLPAGARGPCRRDHDAGRARPDVRGGRGGGASTVGLGGG